MSELLLVIVSYRSVLLLPPLSLPRNRIGISPFLQLRAENDAASSARFSVSLPVLSPDVDASTLQHPIDVACLAPEAAVGDFDF